MHILCLFGEGIRAIERASYLAPEIWGMLKTFVGLAAGKPGSGALPPAAGAAVDAMRSCESCPGGRPGGRPGGLSIFVAGGGVSTGTGDGAGAGFAARDCAGSQCKISHSPNSTATAASPAQMMTRDRPRFGQAGASDRVKDRDVVLDKPRWVDVSTTSMVGASCRETRLVSTAPV
jgi:hypothetical protein